MIKLEPSDLKNICTFSPGLALERLNKILEERFNELKESGAITVKCERHYPAGSNPLSDAWMKYNQICGGCGISIYPERWNPIDE